MILPRAAMICSKNNLVSTVSETMFKVSMPTISSSDEVAKQSKHAHAGIVHQIVDPQPAAGDGVEQLLRPVGLGQIALDRRDDDPVAGLPIGGDGFQAVE